MLVARSLKSCADRMVILRERCDQPIEVVELVQNCQTATALLTRNGDQNFMAGFGNINRNQNRHGLCNSGIGYSRSPLRCGLLQNHCRDLNPALGRGSGVGKDRNRRASSIAPRRSDIWLYVIAVAVNSAPCSRSAAGLFWRTTSQNSTSLRAKL